MRRRLSFLRFSSAAPYINGYDDHAARRHRLVSVDAFAEGGGRGDGARPRGRRHAWLAVRAHAPARPLPAGADFHAAAGAAADGDRLWHPGNGRPPQPARGVAARNLRLHHHLQLARGSGGIGGGGAAPGDEVGERGLRRRRPEPRSCGKHPAAVAPVGVPAGHPADGLAGHPGRQPAGIRPRHGRIRRFIDGRRVHSQSDADPLDGHLRLCPGRRGRPGVAAGDRHLPGVGRRAALFLPPFHDSLSAFRRHR